MIFVFFHFGIHFAVLFFCFCPLASLILYDLLQDDQAFMQPILTALVVNLCQNAIKHVLFTSGQVLVNNAQLFMVLISDKIAPRNNL